MSADRHAEIDAHAERAKAETREFAREVMDRISIKIGFWIRSDAQKRRYEKAKREVQK